MIDRKTATRAFQGLTGMVGIPLEKEAVRLRLEAFRMRARSEGHAERVVKHIRETCQFFPTEAQIVEACEYIADDATLVSAAEACSYCGGQHWVMIDGPFGLSAAYRCNHLGPVPLNVGVRITPAMAKHYAIEAEAARIRREVFWREQEQNPDPRRGVYEQRMVTAGGGQ